mmetsp:Transcript_40253/g.82388  ORF Transcript_40253/g.82388 Transcript_40253/m.82388 type:complete len:317 (-) Transcript_40253:1881-2831(-)
MFHLRNKHQDFFRFNFFNINLGFPKKTNIFYERLGLIDTGTYGKVFRVRRNQTQKIYACKEIQNIQRETDGVSTPLRELNLLFSFNHPNIIYTHEAVFGLKRNQILFMMEYCEYDLKSILDSQIKFSMVQIKIIIKQVLRGLCVLHDNWIIHRDLKTSNLLLNNKGVIKICDFGLARLYYPGSSFMTQGVVTLWYRAPEILLGQKFYNFSIDIWSLGCIMGELIFNDVLFSGKTELDQLGKIFNLIGSPTSEIWINLHSSDIAQKIIFPIQPYNNLRKKFGKDCDPIALDLLQRLLTYDPDKRVTVRGALNHQFFS